MPWRRTMAAASLVALVGVVVMSRGALASGHLPGDLLALIMTILISAMMVIVRRNRKISILPAACLSAFLCAVIVAPVSHPLAATAHDLRSASVHRPCYRRAVVRVFFSVGESAPS